MTPVSDTPLEALHSTATGIFTGALQACNIGSAFDRRLRFEGNTLQRLMPDGSGPATIDLSTYKRIFVIALGKAAGPMLEILLDRMKRRKGLRGVCCTNQLPLKRNWRFRYFEGGHPLPNEDSFAAARVALALLRKARKDTLVFFLISGGGSAMFDLPIDPHITLEDTVAFHQLLIGSGAPINEINTLRKHFSAVKGGRLAMAAPEAAKVSLFFRMFLSARSMRFPPALRRPITPRWLKFANSLPSTDSLPNFPRLSGASLSAKICPSHLATRRGIRRSCRACHGRTPGTSPRPPA
jgi:hypothetical protein